MTAGAAQTQGSLAKLQSTVAKNATGLLALGAAAAVTVHSFLEFEETMTRIETLAGQSAGQVAAWSDELLKIGPQLAKGPQELAEALYFVASSGIATGKAMGVVVQSAKASALGLGETKVVADAVTSAMNAYAAENLSAAMAASILMLAVREGKGEADAIAGAIGRVIPVAAEMGVGFDEVGAAIASMTRLGLDAEESVTALRGILTSMLDPTAKAEAVLAQYGFTVEGIQSSIASSGILDTLFQMQEAFGAFGDSRAMGQVFGNVRALVGALNLTGQSAAQTVKTFKLLASATGGEVNEAFKVLAETTSFKLKRAWATLQAAAIELGGALAPLVEVFSAVVMGMSELGVLMPVIIGFVAALTVAMLGLSAAASLVVGIFVGWAAAVSFFRAENERAVTSLAAMTLAGGAAAEMAAHAIEKLAVVVPDIAAKVEEASNALMTSALFSGALEQVGAEAESVFGSVASSIGELPPSFNEAGVAVEAFAGMNKEAFQKFKEDATESIREVVGSLEGFERKWGLTSAAAFRAMEGMVAKSREMRNAYDELDKMELLPKFRTFMHEQGPAAIVAFVGGSKEQQEKFVKKWQQTNDNVQAAISDLPAWLKEKGRASGTNFGLGLIGGMDAIAGQVAARARMMAAGAVAAVNAELGIGSPSKVAHEIGINFMLGFATGIQDGLSSVVDALRDAVGEGLAKVRLRQAKELEAMASDVVDHLERLKDRMASFRDDIRSGFAGFSLTEALVGQAGDLAAAVTMAQAAVVAAQEGVAAAVDPGALAEAQAALAEAQAVLAAAQAAQAAGPEAFQATMEDQLAQAQEFAAMLTALAKQGLNPQLLAQLAAQGPEAMPFMQGLLAGGQEMIDQFNATQEAINAVTQATVDALSEEAFGSKFRAAAKDVLAMDKEIRQFLRGLHAEAIAAGANTLIDALRDLARALGNFPSPQGAAHGLHGTLDADMLIMAHAGERVDITPRGVRTPQGVAALASSGAGGGGGITVNLPNYLGAKEDVARAIRAELLKIGHRNGTTGLE